MLLLLIISQWHNSHPKCCGTAFRIDLFISPSALSVFQQLISLPGMQTHLIKSCLTLSYPYTCIPISTLLIINVLICTYINTFVCIYVPNAVVKDTFQMDVYMHSYTYRNPTGFPGENVEHIVKMSVIHVRETEMNRALNLHTAPSTEVPVCARFSCS